MQPSIDKAEDQQHNERSQQPYLSNYSGTFLRRIYDLHYFSYLFQMFYILGLIPQSPVIGKFVRTGPPTGVFLPQSLFLSSALRCIS